MTTKININLPSKGYLAPYLYPHFYEHWNQMRNKNIWTVDRISFLQDKVDYENLTTEEQYFVKYLLASFGVNELSIGRNWAARLLQHIQNEEIQLALTEIMAQECFTDETELLTEKGFLPINQIPSNTKLAQYNTDTREISFCKPISFISKHYSGFLERYSDGIGAKNTQILCTEGHNLIEIHPSRKTLTKTASNTKKRSQNYLFPVGQEQKVDSTFDDLDSTTRVYLALQTDGSMRELCPSMSPDSTVVTIGVSKERKIKRLKKLLNLAGFRFRCEPIIKKCKKREDNEDYLPETIFSFELSNRKILEEIKDLSFIDLTKLTPQQAREIIIEISHWDSSKRGDFISYYSVSKKAIDKLQAIAVLAGASSKLSINRPPGYKTKIGTQIVETKKTCYVLHITLDKPYNTYGVKEEKIEYDGEVYCYEMPLGTLVTRSKDGNIVIAGNCNHAVSYQKLAEVIGFETEFPRILEDNPILIKRMEALEGKGLELIDSIIVSTYFGEKAALFTSFFLLGDFTQRTGMLCGLNDVNMYSWKDEYILESSHVKVAQDLLSLFNYDPLKDPKVIKLLNTLLEEIEYPFIDSLPIPKSWQVEKQELKDYVKWRVFEDKNPATCPERMKKFEEMIRGTDVNAFFERKGAGSYAKDNFVDDWD